VCCCGLHWAGVVVSWEAGGVRGEGRIAGCGPRPSGLPRACPQGCPVTRSYPFKFGGAGGKHRTKRRLHATPTAGWGRRGGAWRSRRRSPSLLYADMLRSRSEEGAALRHTAGVTREPAPNLVGLPCAPGSALSYGEVLRTTWTALYSVYSFQNDSTTPAASRQLQNTFDRRSSVGGAP
jgi:hypothetical protein